MTRNVIISVGFVAFVQFAILIVEMFFWRKPWVHRRLGYSQVDADRVGAIVANAGLYNGFLAAGLIWGLVTAHNGTEIEIFFLSCVFIAGVFGAMTLKPTTLVIQSLPSAVTLFLVLKGK